MSVVFLLVLKAELQKSDVIFFNLADRYTYLCHYIHLTDDYLSKNLMVLIFQHLQWSLQCRLNVDIELFGYKY